eukprot:GILJ01003555.1.p1 GENE.GILJ01003555.1~~GILJ01003555.1.p1  ORF type:complete len:127 (+),score=2.76 GILJ01003555.1:42-383(+)
MAELSDATQAKVMRQFKDNLKNFCHDSIDAYRTCAQNLAPGDRPHEKCARRKKAVDACMEDFQENVDRSSSRCATNWDAFVQCEAAGKLACQSELRAFWLCMGIRQPSTNTAS